MSVNSLSSQPLHHTATSSNQSQAIRTKRQDSAVRGKRKGLAYFIAYAKRHFDPITNRRKREWSPNRKSSSSPSVKRHKLAEQTVKVERLAAPVYRPLVDSFQFMHGDFAAGCPVEIEANLNKVGEIERCNPGVKDPCRNGKDQLEAGIKPIKSYDGHFIEEHRDYIEKLFLQQSFSFVAIGEKPFGIAAISESPSSETCYTLFASDTCIVKDFMESEEDRKCIIAHKGALEALFLKYSGELSTLLGPHVTAFSLFQDLIAARSLSHVLTGAIEGMTLAKLLDSPLLLGVLLGYGYENSLTFTQLKERIKPGENPQALHAAMNFKCSFNREELHTDTLTNIVMPPFFGCLDNDESKALKSKYLAAQKQLSEAYNKAVSIEDVTLKLLKT